MAVPRYDQTLAAALIDGTGPRWSNTRLLGVRLRKFSLWHRTLLLVVGSPFTNNGAMTLRDIRIAVGICRLSYGDSRIRKPWLCPFLIWSWAVLKALMPRLGKNPRPIHPNPLQLALKDLADRFIVHCEDYIHNPEYGIIPRPKPPDAAPQVPRGHFPDELEHVGELVQYFHGALTLAEIWDMPIGQANYWRVLYQRSAGLDVTVVDEEERRFQETLPPEYRHR